MPYCLRVKPGVQFDPIAPAGFRILSALEVTARRLKLDITITCGSEDHAPGTPHSLGEAYDFRTHDWTQDQKLAVLREAMLELCDDATSDAPLPVSGGTATAHFYGQIEHPNVPNEHGHIQRRAGTIYGRPPPRSQPA